MNKLLFRLLVLLMSISLIGIIVVQVYWFNSSLQNNQEQFGFHVKQVIGNVATKLKEQEIMSFVEKINQYKDSTGSDKVDTDFLEFGYYQRNSQTNETIIYSNSIITDDFSISPSFFDTNYDSLQVKSFSSKRKTEVYSKGIDKNDLQHKTIPDLKIRKIRKVRCIEKIAIRDFI